MLFAVAFLGQGIGMDFDTGKEAIGAANAFAGEELSAKDGGLNTAGWVRLRGVAASEHGSEEIRVKSQVAVSQTQEALAKLRARGLKTCVLLRWPADRRNEYLPKDLREAFGNGRRLGATIGDLVDAWEVNNESDLGFVPESAESYTAFLKATYLGFQRGLAEAKGRGTDVGAAFALPTAPGRPTSAISEQRVPLVLMGSLGLPPGPWLERFGANDGFSYTDGFNYHYYGYAEDFSGVYRQFEAAVRELSGDRKDLGAAASAGPTLRQKSLPIFLTEIGYGMLGKAARDTKEGRLRQWRWFKSVGEQAVALRIEAPMAFYLQPYLEYDTLEFGLTAPARQGASAVAKAMADSSSRIAAGEEKWTAGGLEYAPDDFGVKRSEPWMERIGTRIDGNEVTPALGQWLAMRARSREQGAQSRRWKVSVAAPSPVVIDFLNGEALSFVKRYNGSFVTAKEPVALGKPETGRRLGADGEANLKPEDKQPPKPTTNSQQPTTPSRTEEFMLHVRTANGNLYEVYPTRQATPEWQRYLEHRDNLTMSFYGRAELPWRFKDNKPASLVIVMYPKQLPATYEFKRVQLLKLGARSREQGGKAEIQVRYGRGKVILYNFSEREVSGRLKLPQDVATANAELSAIKLAPGERREIEVSIQVPADRFQRIDAPIQFVPEDAQVPTARFLTSYMPDIGGMPATVAAQLLPQQGAGAREQRSNRDLIMSRVRAVEETPMKLAADSSKLVAFSQEGATVEPTADGFAVSVTGRVPGKERRIEVEIPWPDGLPFAADEFLSLEFRLRP